MPLPLIKTTPSTDMAALYWLVYGPPGIGKSTFAAGFPDCMFLTTERAHRHLSIFDREIKDWPDFRLALTEVRAAGSKYKNIAIDIVDIAYKFCTDFVCKKLGIDHPQDEGYGKGYDSVNTEFQRAIIQASLLGKGIIFISHAKDKEVTGRNIKYTKTVPSISGGAHKVLTGLVDVECYLGFGKKDVDSRVAIFKPQEHLEAKDRFGRFPDEVFLPKGRTYQAIVEAWNRGPMAPKPVGAVVKRVVRKV